MFGKHNFNLCKRKDQLFIFSRQEMQFIYILYYILLFIHLYIIIYILTVFYPTPNNLQFLC